jgi:hypothetical protein
MLRGGRGSDGDFGYAGSCGGGLLCCSVKCVIAVCGVYSFVGRFVWAVPAFKTAECSRHTQAVMLGLDRAERNQDCASYRDIEKPASRLPRPLRLPRACGLKLARGARITPACWRQPGPFQLGPPPGPKSRQCCARLALSPHLGGHTWSITALSLSILSPFPTRRATEVLTANEDELDPLVSREHGPVIDDAPSQ